MSPPIALTDDQLDQIMRCAAPLHPRVRRLFVENVAHALRGKIVDGEVWRACAAVLRESGMFDPPLESHHMATSRASASTRADLTSAETRDYRADAKQVIWRKNTKSGLFLLAMAYAMTASLVPVHAVPMICIDPAGKTDEEINRLYTAEDTPCPLDRPPIGYHGYEGKGGKIYYLISRDHWDAIPFDNLHTCMLATTIKHRKNSFCVADPDNNKKKKK